MAMLKPLLANMATSFGASPMVAISPTGMPSRSASSTTAVPLFASGWVTSR